MFRVFDLQMLQIGGPLMAKMPQMSHM